MKSAARKLSLAFSAGAMGGLINSLALWAMGASGINAALGVGIAPALTPAWLYPRLVWGGIWGALFLLPLKGPAPTRGLILSLAPTAFQLFYVFPIKAGKGMMGLEHGALTPIVVLLLNALWGLSAAFWLRLSGERK